VRAGLNDREAFAKEAAVDAFRDTPPSELLTSLHGKDVLISFVESYGKNALENQALSSSAYTSANFMGLISSASFTAVASASFVYLALASKNKWLQSVLSNRFLIYSGLISYGIYLLEKIPSDALKSFHLNAHPAIVLLLTGAITYLMATLSWNLLERPALRLKRFFEPERTIPSTSEAVLARAS